MGSCSGNWSPGWSHCYLSCLNEWLPSWSHCITFSYITCLNKRNLPKANKAKEYLINVTIIYIYIILIDNYKYSNSYNSLNITIEVDIAQG